MPSWPHFAHSPSESLYPDLWRGLVGAWCPGLGVQAPPLFDLSGNGNHGTLTSMGATSWVTRPPIGSALDFDGSADYIDAGTGASHNVTGNQLTIAYWVYSIRSSDYDYHVARQQSTLATNTGYAVYATGVSSPDILIFDVGNTEVVYVGALPRNEWHYVTAIYNGANLLMYVDGVAKTPGGSDTKTGNIPSDPSSLLIGKSNWTTAFLSGAIGEVRIYNRALSPEEVLFNYQVPLAPFMLRPKRILVSVAEITAPVLHSSSSPWPQRGQFGPLLAH